MDDRTLAANTPSNHAVAAAGNLVPSNLSIASARDDHDEAQLIATIQGLQQTIYDLQQALLDQQQTTASLTETTGMLVEKTRLGEMAVAELQLGQKRNEDEIYLARNDLSVTRNNVETNRVTISQVTQDYEKTKKQLTEKINIIQRGINCFERLLDLRHFRQAAKGNRSGANSTVLDQHSRKIGTMMKWFEKISLNEFKAEDIRSFFEKNKGRKGRSGDSSAVNVPQDEANILVEAAEDKTVENNNMDVEEDEDELKVYV